MPSWNVVMPLKNIYFSAAMLQLGARHILTHSGGQETCHGLIRLASRQGRKQSCVGVQSLDRALVQNVTESSVKTSASNHLVITHM